MVYYEPKNEVYFEVGIDKYASNPRKFGCNSTFITFENGYYSPDKCDFENFEAVLDYLGTKHTGNMRNDLDNMRHNALKKGIVALPIWKYEHGPCCLYYEASESYPFYDVKPSSTIGYMGGWDGGLCGVIFEKRNRRNIKMLENKLKDEVIKYSKWVNDEVYSIEAYDQKGNHLDSIGDIYDSPACSIELLETAINDFGFDEKINIKDVEELNYGGNCNDIEKIIALHQQTIKEK